MIYAIVFIVFMGSISVTGVIDFRAQNEKINCSEGKSVTSEQLR